MNDPSALQLHPRRAAIVAADAVASLGADAEEIWRRMLANECGIRPLRRLSRGAYLTDLAGEIPSEIESAIRARAPGPERAWAWPLALAVARGVLDAAAKKRLTPFPNTGLILSTTKSEIGAIERMATQPDQPVDEHHNAYALARDLAAALGLKGPVFAVSNACASGLIAVIQAARLLERGDADRMMVVGVDVLSDFILAGFSSLNALSRRPCRPYDARRDGLSLGEGSGALLMTRCADADGPALGTVLGWGASDDATHLTAPSRSGEGLRRALEQALKTSGLAASDIHFVNGHGTGTVYNDEMEARALHDVFGSPTPPVASMKGYFGHTLGAAGVIETILSLIALRERLVPGGMGLEELGVSAPIRVPSGPLHLPAADHAVALKCGFGGINAAVVLGRGETP